jgi:hypothetical protein
MRGAAIKYGAQTRLIGADVEIALASWVSTFRACGCCDLSCADAKHLGCVNSPRR